LLPSLYSLRDHRAATTVRTIDPAIARLLLGLVRVDNDLRQLTAAQQQCAALARLRFAAQFPEVASASSKSQP
jgi:ABC-type transport system involved in cytochrome c biogenesis ATPase subunit